MLTLPRLIDRPARHYVAIRKKVSIPFDSVIGPTMGALFGAIENQQIRTDGPVFFKYNMIKMPELQIDFGIPVRGDVAAKGELVSGTLPAGRYAELTYFGHYDNLMDVNALMIGWAREKGIAWDATPGVDGDHFAARLEIYHNSPDEEPDPSRWETTLLIKVKG